MVFFRLAARFILISLLALGFVEVGYSQCSGITGGAITLRPGQKCANLDALGGPLTGGEIRIEAYNVPVFPIVSSVSFLVNWDDGTSSNMAATKDLITPTTWRVASLVHYFPTTGANV